MKLACADDTFRLFEHEHILALIHMLGLDGGDLCLMEGRSAVRPGDVRADARLGRGWRSGSAVTGSSRPTSS